METASYNDAIQVAANLIEPENFDAPIDGGNPEYVRGQVELICDLFGYAKYGEEPREAVEEDLRRAVAGVREPSHDAPNLAQAWKDNPELQQMAELFGRLQSRRRSLLSDAETWSRAITLTLLDTLKRQLEGEED